MFVVPLRPVDAAALVALGRSAAPESSRFAGASPRRRRSWRRRPMPAHG